MNFDVLVNHAIEKWTNGLQMVARQSIEARMHHARTRQTMALATGSGQ